MYMTSLSLLPNKFFTAFIITALVLVALPASPAFAASITVNTTIDENTNNASCSLREAIIAANNNASYNGCIYTGSGPDDVITLTSNLTYTLSIVGEDADEGDLDVGNPLGSSGNLTIQASGATNAIIADGQGGTHQAREERDVIVRSSLARLEQLRLGDESLCFGRIDQIDANIVNWLGTNPRTVLLHIGTNDVLQNFDLANAPARLSALVDRITATVPNADVFVATIIPMAGEERENAGRAYNATIPGMVQSKRNAGKRVHLVDMHSALTTADLIDGVHPTATGYDKMAATWYAATRAVPGAIGDPGTPGTSGALVGVASVRVRHPPGDLVVLPVQPGGTGPEPLRWRR